MPKFFDPEFKAEIIRKIMQRDPRQSRTAAIIALIPQQGLPAEGMPVEETLRRWAKQAEIDAGLKPGLTTTALLAKRQREARERRLSEDAAILKAAGLS